MSEDMLSVMQVVSNLKDDPPERSRMTLHLQEQFGFIPEVIIIDKVKGKNNKIIVSAVVPKDLDKIKSKKLKKKEKMKIDTEVFITVLLAMVAVEFLKAALTQILIDRRHNHMMRVLDSDGFKNFVNRAEEMSSEDN